MDRIWDKFLTEQDKEHLAAGRPRRPIGTGQRPAILLIDNYRRVIGDRPEPLLEAMKTWPSSTGLAGWRALEAMGELLDVARAARLPVVHVTALKVEDSGVPGWSARLRGTRGRSDDPSQMSPEQRDRHERRYDIVEQVAPVDGEAVIRKSAPSAFFGTPLASHLNALGIDTLIVGGESTSGCVRASVVDAASYGFRVGVVEECVYDRHEAAHAINLFDMSRKYADVVPLESALQWISGGREFASEPA